jgi:hypothetical protein
MFEAHHRLSAVFAERRHRPCLTSSTLKPPVHSHHPPLASVRTPLARAAPSSISSTLPSSYHRFSELIAMVALSKRVAPPLLHATVASPHAVVHSHTGARVVKATPERHRLQPQSTSSSTTSTRQCRDASSCSVTVSTHATSARPNARTQCGRDPPVGLAQCGSGPCTTAVGHTQHYASGTPPGSAHEALYLFYFLNIFKSLHVQKFVHV